MLKPKEMATVMRGGMEAALLVMLLLVVGVLGRERCTTDQQRKMQVLIFPQRNHLKIA